MLDLTVRRLSREDSPLFRGVRLAALHASRDELRSTSGDEASAKDTQWRVPMASAQRLVLEMDGRVCGVVPVGRLDEEPELADTVGLWVDSSARSSGAAGRLVDMGIGLAAAGGAERMYDPVGTQDARAIAFATGFGLRVSSHRRAIDHEQPTTKQPQIAVVLPLEDDAITHPDGVTDGFVHRRTVGTQGGR